MDLDAFGRPFWNDYFMAMTFLIAQRSIDPNTKHGCVITTPSHRVLTMGYNGPPRGADDSKVPLTSPAKYPYMMHAESNAIDNTALSGVSLEGGIAYVTGRPCSSCLGRLIQNGITEIIYGGVSSNCVDVKDQSVSESILDCLKEGKKPIMTYYDRGQFILTLQNAISYAESKYALTNQTHVISRFLKDK